MVEVRTHSPIVAIHLTASPFLGGPERQMLGLARSLPSDQVRTVFWTFAEGGKSRPFAEEAARLGFVCETLERNAPAFAAVVGELTAKLNRDRPDVLLCHGYKSDVLGGIAARRVGIPVVAVSRGWTGVTWKVRMNEVLDRLSLVGMDRVVCVSEGQAAKVRRSGVPSGRVVVIRNAIDSSRFDRPDPSGRSELAALFAEPPARIVGAAGRLSPEKGFEVFIESASTLARTDPGVGFVIFGEGPLRERLAARIEAEGLSGRFVLSPFRDDLDRLIPHLDLVAIPSYTEGLPNVGLEAAAGSVAIVATDVGGNPEVVDDGRTGYLVPAGDPSSLATRLGQLLANPSLRAEMGRAGRCRIAREFDFGAQARAYLDLFGSLDRPRSAGGRRLRSIAMG